MADERIGVPLGRLSWTRDGTDLVAARYRIRLRSPGVWETTFRDRPLHIYPRRSMALSGAEHHHREVQRTQQITRWSVLAGAALLVCLAVVDSLNDPVRFLLFAVAVWVFLRSLARATASASRNLLDPYRTREEWEAPDWYNKRE